MYDGLWLINIYVPSGTAGRHERETFYNNYPRFLFIQEGSERLRDHLAMENFYYEDIYDILQNMHSHGRMATTFRRLKARIMRLHSMGQRRVF